MSPDKAPAVEEGRGRGDEEHGWTGGRRRRLRASLAMTPAERLEIVEEMYRLALEAGAIERVRRRKQKTVDAAWGMRRDAPRT